MTCTRQLDATQRPVAIRRHLVRLRAGCQGHFLIVLRQHEQNRLVVADTDTMSSEDAVLSVLLDEDDLGCMM